MRNLKKVLSVLIVMAMLLTSFVPAFAASQFTYEAQARTLYDLGLFKGVSTDPDVFDPALGLDMDRQSGVVMMLRLVGKIDTANSIDQAEAEEILSKYTDADEIEDWAVKAMAYAIKNGLVIGTSETELSPLEQFLGKMFAGLILRNIGYEVTAENYDTACAMLVEKGGLTVDQALKFNDKELIRDDLVGMSYGSLKAKYADTGKTIIETLVEDGKVDREKAEDAGLISPVVTTLDVKSAVALNSKVVEVVLNTAVSNVAKTAVTVKDSAGAEVAVKSVEAAPYAKDGKTLFVTLEKDTTVGALYTLTSGTKSINFGGKSVDTEKPTVTNVASTEYNKIEITFSEGVKLEGMSISVAERYNNNTALEIINMEYNGKDKIVLTTAEQKGSTLYEASISNIVDFSGNLNAEKYTSSFGGTAKDTTELKVNFAAALNPEEVVVEFNVNVDPATVTASAFKVGALYGNNETLAVASARMATKDDKGVGGADLTAATAKKHVILSVPGLKDSTMYKVTAVGVKSIYGKDLSTSSDDQSKTFAGKAKPTTEVEMSNVIVNSNTQVTVSFARKITEETAENLANYAIVESYLSSSTLDVVKAELQANGKDVKLTVAPMKNVLYKITVTGITDIYGNALKTSDSKNTTNFAGAPVADRITKIEEIERVNSTVIIVRFDQNVGSSATDVSHYFIDNGVGYPEKAEIITDTAVANYAKKVKLTIPKTADGKVLKLTVKGLENADGIQMDASGVSATFVGQGTTSTLPELQGVFATDNQTIKLYFDRDVTDSRIAGPIWNKSTNQLVSGAISYLHNTNITTDIYTLNHNVFQDPENANALVIRVDVDDAFKSINKDTTTGAFKVIGAAAKFKTDKNALMMASNESEPTAIIIESVQAINNKTVRVYFNQPVYGTMKEFAKIGTTKDASSFLNFDNAVAIDDTNRVYDFRIAGTNEIISTTYWLVADMVNKAVIGDADKNGTDIVTLKDEDTNTAGIQHFRQFAGSSTSPSDIKEISLAMKDEKTLIVYFPEAMDVSSVESAANYIIAKNSDMTGDVSSTIADIKYDKKTNTATFILNTKIDTATAFLKVKNTVKNALQTASVKDGDKEIVRQFAVSSSAAAKVTVSSATYASGVITVEFNQAFKSTADLDVAANLVNALDITVRTAEGDHKLTVGEMTIVAKDENGNIVNDTTAGFAKKLEITINGVTLTAGQVGKVEINSNSGITGINGNAADADSYTVFAH